MRVRVLAELNLYALDCPLEIFPDQRWNVILALRPAKRVSYGRLANRLNVGGRKPGYVLGHALDAQVQLQLLQISMEEPFPVGLAGRTDFDFFRETASPKNGRIDAIHVVCRPHQENVVLRQKLTDFGTALLHKLRVMRVQHAIVAWQQAVDLVEEDNRGAVFARACE